MIILKPDTSGTIDFDGYLEKINSEKDRYSERVFSFASDFNRYSLGGSLTLHDSRLLSINFIQLSQVNKSTATIELKSADENRITTIIYMGVRSLEIGNPEVIDTRYSDLVLHEVRLCEEEIVHEFMFDQGLSVLFRCIDFEVMDLYT